MKIKSIKELHEILIDSFSHVTFTYNGKRCGIDPMAKDDFDVWYGEDLAKAHNIEEISSQRIYNGKSLEEIITEVTDFDY
ncbi:MAG: hypothetical protein ACK5JH_15250 [Anaerocolumna sp.]